MYILPYFLEIKEVFKLYWDDFLQATYPYLFIRKL